MSRYSRRLQPHREEKSDTYRRKGFSIETALSEKKLNRHFLIGLIGALFGNKILAVIYLYHQYKLRLLLNGKNQEKAGKEHSYYVRLCIMRELTIITLCFRLFLFVVFMIGLANAINNMTLYATSIGS